MHENKILLFLGENTECVHCKTLFSEDYKSIIVKSTRDLINILKREKVDLMVVCLCSAQENDLNLIVGLNTITENISKIICTKKPDSQFVFKAAKLGFNKYIHCDMDKEKIYGSIEEEIAQKDTIEFIQQLSKKNEYNNYHVNGIIENILIDFPQRLSEKTLAVRLGISINWLQKICRKEFNLTYVELRRIILVYKALQLMKYSNMDNKEIAFQLNYSEESNMARDIRKVINQNPTEARLKLKSNTPEEMIFSNFK